MKRMNKHLKMAVDWAIIILLFAGTLLSPLLEKYLGLYPLVNSLDSLIKISIWVAFGGVFLGLLTYLFLREGAGVFKSSSLFWLLIIFITVCAVLSQVARAWDRLHFAAFWFLCLFLFRALRNHTNSQMLYFWSLAIIVVFALMDEFNEALVFGREFSVQDLSLNLLSATFYIIVIALVIRPKLDPVAIGIHRQVDELSKKQEFLKSFYRRKH
ncbi:MAG: VanZ family protein [Candidatus Omnitrophica bacterium]|nr:VanZ family protein [Candidatus Omnitrophota bacterium]MBU1869604.1 VanZ family protein [Candidatus Omnitrophota bacterium]